MKMFMVCLRYFSLRSNPVLAKPISNILVKLIPNSGPIYTRYTTRYNLPAYTSVANKRIFLEDELYRNYTANSKQVFIQNRFSFKTGFPSKIVTLKYLERKG